MNAMPFEQNIQIGVGETTGTPMLLRDDIARLGFELPTELPTPRSVFERPT
jgi:hypothetical protein